MDLEQLKGKIICGTGHRPDKLGGYSNEVTQKLIRVCRFGLEKLQPSLVISGMALGYDQALAEAAIELKIPFHAYCPCYGQDSKWPPASSDRYRKLLEKASQIVYVTKDTYKPNCMQLRNIAMVDASDIVLTLWNGTGGGTANCIEYAKTQNKIIFNLWQRFISGVI